ncbi:MAG: prephenate dehydrogenase [Clostridiales bacterium]|jgi:prephenate dehydrogenase|nr:prephenate dehydrogenase [Clostridiales bacterium]
MRAGIIGLGLIGGSIAKALKKHNLCEFLAAFDKNASSLSDAKETGVADEISTDDLGIFAGCDVVFVCAPVSDIPAYLAKLESIVGDECLVTDVGSTKEGVLQAACKFKLNFVGGHPMAGSERTGFANSSDFLFENAYYIIVPDEKKDRKYAEFLCEIIRAIGAIPIELDACTHDEITSAISHTPHVVAAALANTVRKLDTGGFMRDIAAGGFKDITRIASSDSLIWQEITYENRKNILNTLCSFRKELDEVAKYLSEGNVTETGAYFRLAKNYRDSLPVSSRVRYDKTYELYVDVEDKPGVIAVISTALGVAGVNIKNIGIVNNREYAPGALQISFGNTDDREKGADILSKMRYEIYWG